MNTPVRESADALAVSALLLINSLVRLAISPRHRDEFLSATGLDMGTADIRTLEFLSGRPPVPISQIAAAQGIDLAQASRQVSRLAARELLMRTPDHEDRRRTLVTVTTPARRATDAWLHHWSNPLMAPCDTWLEADVAELASCIREQVSCLQRALPDQPVLTIDDRWDELIGHKLPPQRRALGRALVALVTWVGQSNGFDDLLATADSPLRQTTFLALSSIVRHGPLTITGVATALTIDPAQASKWVSTLTELGLVERTRAVHDRRQILVSASPLGCEFEESVYDLQRDSYRNILPRVSDSRQQRWTQLLTHYVAALDFVDDRNH